MRTLIALCALAVLCASACKKSDSATEPEHFKLITGTANWHHVYQPGYVYGSGYPTDTMQDVRLSISYVSPTTITVDASNSKDVLTFVSDTNSVLTFWLGAGGPVYDAVLTYNYSTGSANFSRSKHISAAAGNDDNLYYKP